MCTPNLIGCSGEDQSNDTVAATYLSKITHTHMQTHIHTPHTQTYTQKGTLYTAALLYNQCVSKQRDNDHLMNVNSPDASSYFGLETREKRTGQLLN